MVRDFGRLLGQKDLAKVGEERDQRTKHKEIQRDIESHIPTTIHCEDDSAHDSAPIAGITSVWAQSWKDNVGQIFPYASRVRWIACRDRIA